MSCVSTEACKFAHCTNCPHYEIGNLTTKDQPIVIGTVGDVIENLEDSNNKLDVLLEKARAEVAREIFEEINAIKKEYASGDIDENELYIRLYTLEKKYTEPVHCKDCKHLMFSDCYGECAKGYKGIVNPDDTCGYGAWRN